MQPVAQYNSCTVSSASPDIMEQRSGSEATASPSSSTMTAAARLQAARQRLAARRATTTTSACSTSSRTTTTSADREPRLHQVVGEGAAQFLKPPELHLAVCNYAAPGIKSSASFWGGSKWSV